MFFFFKSKSTFEHSRPPMAFVFAPTHQWAKVAAENAGLNYRDLRSVALVNNNSRLLEGYYFVPGDRIITNYDVQHQLDPHLWQHVYMKLKMNKQRINVQGYVVSDS